MGSSWRYYSVCPVHLFDGSVLSSSSGADDRCINARRIKRGGGPVRYTGWTVPSYNQSQQQYGYTGNQGYDMNTYPQQGPYQQTSYQGQPQAPYNGTNPNTPAYFDASVSQGTGSYLHLWHILMGRCLSTSCLSSTNETRHETIVRICLSRRNGYMENKMAGCKFNS